VNHYVSKSAICEVDESEFLNIHSCNGDKFTVEFNQLWKGCDSNDEISWWRLITLNDDGTYHCGPKSDEVDEVGYDKVPLSQELQCGADGTAQVILAVHDGQFTDHHLENIYSCEGQFDEVMTLSYTFKCGGVQQDRRMHEEAFKHDTVHDEDDEDVPYCLSKDYPCEGEEDNMVYVCHYSARQGYQTFCVPEADSDILRFYPHDYCGTCKYGGN